MESIEADYESLRGMLPKSEYHELDNDVLGQLLRTLDPDELKRVSGDVFGRIYRRARVSNGNYVWISYFHSSLNRNGRAGFVMSSQASSAGGAEAAVRRKLVETGDVEVMIAIRSNFFYTRTVPCELWFLNRAKPERRRGKVLMIDARAIFRKVTRKIYDFSPEQMRNLLAIVHLYVGIAPDDEEEDFDFAQTLRNIHAELDDLDAESVTLAAKIRRNFKALRVFS